MSDILAEVSNVSYLYPKSERPVLDNVNLKIHKGEFLGLVGPTGAGKTTLSLAMSGIIPQFFGGRFFGRITVMGLDTLEHPVHEMSRHIGMVFEDPETQITSTSVENEIAFALENLCTPREGIIDRIPRVLEAVRLEGMEKKHPHDLSGGQKQRLAIAASLALRPELLILDEPTSQLDPMGTEEVFSTVKELNRELGVSIIVISHASEEMAEYSQRIVLLSDGKVVRDDTPDVIYSEMENLNKHFLRAPQVSAAFYKIRQKNIPVPAIPVRYSEGEPLVRQLSQSYPVNFSPVEKAVGNRTGEPLLSVKSMKHSYPDGTEALHGIDLDIYEGEYLLIIGQNGAGKSTLVKHFLRLLEPSEGSVKVGGVETGDLEMSGLARKIGYVAQNPDNQIFNTSVENEVAFALKNLKYPDTEVEKRVKESLESMGLWEVREVHPLSLPKGDRARVVIAAILAMKPEIIIFDEPTTGQDYRGAHYILELSRELHKMGKTVIVITHHLYLMPEYAQRVVVMGKGTKLLDTHIRDAFHQQELLKSTFLTVPQAARLAKHIQYDGKTGVCDFLTPDEIADAFPTPGKGA